MADNNTETVTPDQQAMIDRLAELEAEQAKEMGLDEQPKTEGKDDLKTEADQAAEVEVEKAAEPDQADARSDAEPQKEEKPTKEPEVKLSDDERKKYSAFLKQTQSKYSADLGKKLVRWDAIKAREKELETAKAEQEKAYNSRLAQLNSEMEQFKAEQESNRPTPEKYQELANTLQTQVTLKEAEIVKAEAAGDYEKKEQLQSELAVLKEDVRRAGAAADNLRKNPPLTLQKQQERFQEYQKTWIDKAAVDFPEFAKKDSELQKNAAEYYKQMTTSEPAVAKLPGFIYFCVERAALKTAADRVPALEKENNNLKTKVKEYEALTNPTPAGGVSRTPKGDKSPLDMSQDELYESLRNEAMSYRR